VNIREVVFEVVERSHLAQDSVKTRDSCGNANEMGGEIFNGCTSVFYTMRCNSYFVLWAVCKKSVSVCAWYKIWVFLGQ